MTFFLTNRFKHKNNTIFVLDVFIILAFDGFPKIIDSD